MVTTCSRDVCIKCRRRRSVRREGNVGTRESLRFVPRRFDAFRFANGKLLAATGSDTNCRHFYASWHTLFKVASHALNGRTMCMFNNLLTNTAKGMLFCGCVEKITRSTCMQRIARWKTCLLVQFNEEEMMFKIDAQLITLRLNSSAKTLGSLNGCGCLGQCPRAEWQLFVLSSEHSHWRPGPQPKERTIFGFMSGPFLISGPI